MLNKEIHIWKTQYDRIFLCDGKTVELPPEWVFVPSGDPGLTRRLKASGECWVQVYKYKNRIESDGLWTDRERVEMVRSQLEIERADPAYRLKLEAAKRAREAKQDAYVVEFRDAVINFLNFAPQYEDLAWRLADAVTDQAVPVGSGTVARTESIPIERRAEAAVIAWMRHQTTAYDMMTISPVAGERREVRRHLAERSRQILSAYRRGEPVDLKKCPLAQALYGEEL